MRRVHVFVDGKVQGVFYRASTQDKAKALGLKGWVRNLPDGRVEYVAEGPDEAVQELLRWSEEGPAYARVSGLEVREEEPVGEFSDFSVKYD